MAFLTTSGTNFTLNGEIWRPFGASIYNSQVPQSTTNIDNRIAEALVMNLNILRIIDFMPLGIDEDVEYTEANWVTVDYLLHKARLAGIKVLLDCSNYSAKARARGESHSTQDWSEFADFVCNRVNTYNSRVYKNDDTIGLITMAGEVDSQYNEELPAFYANTTAAFKAAGAQQLTGVGGIEWYYGENYVEQVAAASTVDYMGSHTYENNLGYNGKIEYNMAMHHSFSTAYKKPWIIEEFGEPGHTGDIYRAAYMKNMYQEALRYGCGGFLFWNLAPSNGVSGFDVGKTITPRTHSMIKLYSTITTYSPRIPVSAAEAAGYPG